MILWRTHAFTVSDAVVAVVPLFVCLWWGCCARRCCHHRPRRRLSADDAVGLNGGGAGAAAAGALLLLCCDSCEWAQLLFARLQKTSGMNKKRTRADNQQNNGYSISTIVDEGSQQHRSSSAPAGTCVPSEVLKS